MSENIEYTNWKQTLIYIVLFRLPFRKDKAVATAEDPNESKNEARLDNNVRALVKKLGFVIIYLKGLNELAGEVHR